MIQARPPAWFGGLPDRSVDFFGSAVGGSSFWRAASWLAFFVSRSTTGLIISSDGT